MSSSNAETSAVGTQMTLSDGRKWRLTPLDDADMDELTEWCQSEIINMAERSLSPRATKAQRDERLSIAIREAAGITWMSSQGAKMLTTLNGICQMVLVSIRKNHPEVTLDELKVVMRNEKEQSKFNMLLRKANGLPTREELLAAGKQSRPAKKTFGRR